MKKIISILVVIILIAGCNKSSIPANPVPIPIDIDGNVYDTVKICTQFWMKQNLKTTRYRNGDAIPNVTDSTQWANLTTGAWCYYNNNPGNNAVYGKLYNWYAVNDPRGLAPAGWHVPSDIEWATLSTCLGGDMIAGGKMKETSTLLWLSPNTGANNSSGFTGLPGGIRESNSTFVYIGYNAFWWSSTEAGLSYAWSHYLIGSFGDFFRDGDQERSGFSIRCLKD